MVEKKKDHSLQRCPNCNMEQFKIRAGFIPVKSPLVTCRYCGTTFRTELRSEWCHFPNKMVSLYLAGCIAVASLVVLLWDFLNGDMSRALGAIQFLLWIAFFLLLRDGLRILLSIQRMKDPDYLKQLLQYQVIDEAEYQQLCSTAKIPAERR